jgi:hypothetical protein
MIHAIFEKNSKIPESNKGQPFDVFDIFIKFKYIGLFKIFDIISGASISI